MQGGPFNVMTPIEYKEAREAIGSRELVSRYLGLSRKTLHNRETIGPIKREHKLAIEALAEKIQIKKWRESVFPNESK